jgi:alkaline phosphatase D
MRLNRRFFLAQSIRLASLAALAATFPSIALARSASYPFRLGVASGSPRSTGVVLWTRLVTEPFGPVPFAPAPAAVRWEVAADHAFKHIVSQGSVTALPELAHSVHIELDGLQPDRWYWYRFMTADAVSPVGRTRTAPAPGTLPQTLRFAFASCQHWEFGEYAAHRHIAAAAPDLVAFLGDYIYEWGRYDLAHPANPRERSPESITLGDYRMRYSQYKTDPNLQASHEAAPWIVTWDDHEVANDYGNDRDAQLAPDFFARRAAAYQAFYEHMPVRVPALLSGKNRFARMRLYERYDWGRLARFHVLDDRQYRAYQACPKRGQGGSNSVTTSGCAERLEASRTMLGWEQEAWLADGLATSAAKWNVIAQQTLVAQASEALAEKTGAGRFWTDGWDGYPAARSRLFDDIVKHRPANPIVISGDVHTFYAADLKRDFHKPASPENPVIATEFCSTSVTSSSRPQARTDQYLAHNPHIKFGRSDRRGFVWMELTPAKTMVRFQALDDVKRANSGLTTLAHFVVEDGKPGVVRVD